LLNALPLEQLVYLFCNIMTLTTNSTQGCTITNNTYTCIYVAYGERWNQMHIYIIRNFDGSHPNWKIEFSIYSITNGQPQNIQWFTNSAMTFAALEGKNSIQI